MTTTTFTQGTVIESAWLNDVDALVYDVLDSPATLLEIKTTLGIPTSSTGTGAQVLATSPTIVTPTLTTPVLGVATATSINKVAITAPVSSATLTLANGSTLATSGAFSTTLTATATTVATLPAGTKTLAALETVQTWSAAQRGAITALTDAATIALDLSLGNNFSVTLGGSRTLGNPTNVVAGQSGVIAVTQDGTGSRALAYGGNYKFAGGVAPTLTTTAAAVDYLNYYVESATRIFITITKDVK
jgi:hypothetical protein